MSKENNVESNENVVVEEKKRKGIRLYNVIIGIIAALSLGISLANINFDKEAKNSEAQVENLDEGKEDICYRVYIGLTDKDANYQKIDTDTAIEIVKTICITRALAYTIYETNGGGKDENGVLHTGKTLILEMDHITDDELHAVLADVSKRLNAGALMYTKENLEVVYYSNNN